MVQKGAAWEPMKRLARFRRHSTSGCAMGRGADWDVRPVTRGVVPLPRLMKDSANFEELIGVKVP